MSAFETINKGNGRERERERERERRGLGLWLRKIEEKKSLLLQNALKKIKSFGLEKAFDLIHIK